MRIYVGNLPYEITSEDLNREFSAFGEVASADVMKDKYTGQSKGFGFVEMTQVADGQAAITALDGKEMGHRTITVNPARERSEGRGGGSFGGRGGGGGAFGNRGGGKSFGNKKGGGFGKGKPRRY